MDPWTVLGVEPDASPADVAAAYRRLAKRWHPDRAPASGPSGRMAEINAAYDTLRAGAVMPSRRQGGAAGTPPPSATTPTAAWLPEAVRRALGRELLGALEGGEAVLLVTPTATWASPQTLLAVTDRRLLWLLDDVISQRVRSLRYEAIAGIERRLRRPLRRAAVLRVRTTDERTLAFAELRPPTAELIAAHVAAARPAATGARRAVGA